MATMTPAIDEWTHVADGLPPNGEIVETKIDDLDGRRNEGRLVRQGSLWFFPDFSMYVYYRPTHWRRIAN
jgi:hypothetical protein